MLPQGMPAQQAPVAQTPQFDMSQLLPLLMQLLSKGQGAQQAPGAAPPTPTAGPTPTPGATSPTLAPRPTPSVPTSPMASPPGTTTSAPKVPGATQTLPIPGAGTQPTRPVGAPPNPLPSGLPVDGTGVRAGMGGNNQMSALIPLLSMLMGAKGQGAGMGPQAGPQTPLAGAESDIYKRLQAALGSNTSSMI